MAEETPTIQAVLIAKLPSGARKEIKGEPANDDKVAVANLLLAMATPEWGGGRG